MSTSILPHFPRPLLFGHRGVSSLAPENTAASFRKIKETGCPGVELDVHLCASGELVVVHDDTIGRTFRTCSDAGGAVRIGPAPDRRVETLTLAELRSYDIGIWFSPEFRGEKILTLDEVFDILGNDIYTDIEIKTAGISCKDVCRKLAETLAARGKETACIVSSFNPAAVMYFKKYSRVPVALIYSADKGVPFFLRQGQARVLCRPDILKPGLKNIGTGDRPKRLGGKRPYIVWTVDSPDICERLAVSGAEGIISNRPQDMLPVIKRHMKETGIQTSGSPASDGERQPGHSRSAPD